MKMHVEGMSADAIPESIQFLAAHGYNVEFDPATEFAGWRMYVNKHPNAAIIPWGFFRRDAVEFCQELLDACITQYGPSLRVISE